MAEAPLNSDVDGAARARPAPTRRRPRAGMAFAIVLIAACGLLTGAAAIALYKFPDTLADWLSPSGPTRLEPGWAAVATVLAGDGIAGSRDGDVTAARFSDPFGVASAPDGSIYVADAGDAQRIRRIAPDGTVSTFAGSDLGYADGGRTEARFNTPSALAVGATGVIYVADTGNNAIRGITPEGIVSTLAGGGAAGYRDDIGRDARFNGPVGVTVDAAGRVIVADTYNDRIRAIDGNGRVTTLAGSGQPGDVDGPAADARFDTPCGVAVDRAGNIFVADTGNGVVRMISTDRMVSTLGPLPVDGLLRPIGIAVSSEGIVYVTDERGRIIEITPGVRARTLAGSRPGFRDGSGPDALFRGLTGLALAEPGRLVVGDPRNALVRVVTARSRLGLHPPASPRIKPGFDVETFSWQPLLWPVDPMDGPFEIAGTIGEFRGGEGAERLHAGIDIRAFEGTPVRVVRNGVVSNPVATAQFGTLNESVRIGPIAYVHLRVGRRGRSEVLDTVRFVPTYDEKRRIVQMRVKRGARFDTGESIGAINTFNHVHLNIGWPTEEYNPLLFNLVQFEDTVPPTIARGGIHLVGEDGKRITQRTKGRLVVDGPVRIVVDAWDQSNGNEPRRRLGLYRLGYQVLNRSGLPAPGFEMPLETIRFDRMGASEDAGAVLYASGSGIPFYGNRSTRFLYSITNTLHAGAAAPGLWDPRTLPPGDYTLRVLAADIRGNQAIANRDLPITVVSSSRNRDQ